MFQEGSLIKTHVVVKTRRAPLNYHVLLCKSRLERTQYNFGSCKVLSSWPRLVPAELRLISLPTLWKSEWCLHEKEYTSTLCCCPRFSRWMEHLVWALISSVRTGCESCTRYPICGWRCAWHSKPCCGGLSLSLVLCPCLWVATAFRVSRKFSVNDPLTTKELVGSTLRCFEHHWFPFFLDLFSYL